MGHEREDAAHARRPARDRPARHRPGPGGRGRSGTDSVRDHPGRRAIAAAWIDPNAAYELMRRVPAVAARRTTLLWHPTPRTTLSAHAAPGSARRDGPIRATGLSRRRTHWQ